MIGAILGDIIGSPHEFMGAKERVNALELNNGRGLNRATDDSIMTIALADSILNNIPYDKSMKHYYRKYPNKGYGMKFAIWAESEYDIPYGSKGNGAMMRISPVGWVYDTTEETFLKAKEFTEYTHNDPSAVLAATTIATGIFALRNGSNKNDILKNFRIVNGYKDADLEDSILTPQRCDICETMMPVVMAAFDYGNSYKECVETAIYACTDTDTSACIVGSLAECVYTIPQELIDQLPNYLDKELLSIVKQFHDKYINKYKLNF